MFSKFNPFKRKEIPLSASIKRDLDLDIYSIDYSNIEDSKSLKPIFSEWHSMLLLGDFNEVNDFMKWLDLSKMSILSMTALCRISSSWKQNLPHWNQFVIDTAFELENRGVNADREMVGLI